MVSGVNSSWNHWLIKPSFFFFRSRCEIVANTMSFHGCRVFGYLYSIYCSSRRLRMMNLRPSVFHSCIHVLARGRPVPLYNVQHHPNIVIRIKSPSPHLHPNLFRLPVHSINLARTAFLVSSTFCNYPARNHRHRSPHTRTTFFFFCSFVSPSNLPHNS